MTADDPIRVLIADDEPLGRSNIRIALEAEDDVELVRECGEGAEAAAAIQELRPDLVFLDVQMPGTDAFGVIERVGPDNMPPVVFVTAHDEYAVPAFQVHALDFLLKPFDDARFRDTMAHAREQLANRTAGELGRRLRELLDDFGGGAPTVLEPSSAGQFIARFSVKDDGNVVFIRVQDVDYLEASGNYVKIHCREKEYVIRASIRVLAANLDPRRFLRVHKSWIVNLDRVKEVQPWFGGDYIAILHSGQRIRVSRTYARSLLRPWQ